MRELQALARIASSIRWSLATCRLILAGLVIAAAVIGASCGWLINLINPL